MVTSVLLRDRVQGMLAGVAVGDALGMPVETMTREEILLLNGGRGIIGYMDPVQTRVTDTQLLKLGDTTDDWQLTRAVATSLINSKGFDIHDQARTHIAELQKSTFGWGKTTTQGIVQLQNGERLVGQEPLHAGKGKGSGNGIIMKVSPLAAMGVLSNSVVIDEVLELGKLTHPDMRARLAAVVILRYLGRALRGLIDNSSSLVEFNYFLRYLEIKCKKDFETQHFLSSYLWHVDSSSIESLIKTAGVGFTAWETAAFTLGVYSRHRNDFSSAVLEAVNAGGDTDTNASIVGALVGATIGYSNIPETWKSIPVLSEVRGISDRLCDIFG